MNALRPLLTLLLLGALTGCSCGQGDRLDSAARLTLSWQGFEPGCLKVSVEDLADSTLRSEQTLQGSGRSGEAVVAIFRGEGWSDRLRVTATAREKDCAGATVASQTQEVSLVRGEVALLSTALVAADVDEDGWVAVAGGGTDCDDALGQVHPGADEVCDSLDNDCDGEQDEGLSLTVGYPDLDRDGYGAGDAGTLAICGALADGQSSTNDDCRDSLATVYPSAPELCDTYDNDCDGTVDEDLGLTTCTAAGNCSGTQKCNLDGTVSCDFSALPVTYFPDEDRDGRGRSDAGELFCSSPPAGHVQDGGDCDDGDPFTYLAANEICDRKDNDCDLSVDEVGCPSGSDGGWAALAVGGSGIDWQTTSAFDRSSVWTAGTGQGMRVQVVEGAGFSDHDGLCAGENWTASWSSPTNGVGYFGGCSQNAQVLADGGFGCTQGKVAAIESFLPLGCTTKNVGSAQVEGLVGINDNGLRLFGVLADGDTFEWNGTGSNPSGRGSLAGVHLSDIHGVSIGSIYVVGTATAPPSQPRVFKFNASNGSWASQQVENLSGLPADAGLHALWVVRADLIYAVGDAGLVLKYDGTAWSVVPGPPGAGMLTSVRAFGTSAVYVTSGSDIYRYNGTIWELLYRHESLLLHDLTGVAPDALWGVGDDGLVVRWP